MSSLNERESCLDQHQWKTEESERVVIVERIVGAITNMETNEGGVETDVDQPTVNPAIEEPRNDVPGPSMEPTEAAGGLTAEREAPLGAESESGTVQGCSGGSSDTSGGGAQLQHAFQVLQAIGRNVEARERREALRSKTGSEEQFLFVQSEADLTEAQFGEHSRCWSRAAARLRRNAQLPLGRTESELQYHRRPRRQVALENFDASIAENVVFNDEILNEDMMEEDAHDDTMHSFHAQPETDRGFLQDDEPLALVEAPPRNVPNLQEHIENIMNLAPPPAPNPQTASPAVGVATSTVPPLQTSTWSAVLDHSNYIIPPSNRATMTSRRDATSGSQQQQLTSLIETLFPLPPSPQPRTATTTSTTAPANQVEQPNASKAAFTRPNSTAAASTNADRSALQWGSIFKDIQWPTLPPSTQLTSPSQNERNDVSRQDARESGGQQTSSFRAAQGPWRSSPMSLRARAQMQQGGTAQDAGGTQAPTTGVTSQNSLHRSGSASSRKTSTANPNTAYETSQLFGQWRENQSPTSDDVVALSASLRNAANIINAASAGAGLLSTSVLANKQMDDLQNRVNSLMTERNDLKMRNKQREDELEKIREKHKTLTRDYNALQTSKNKLQHAQNKAQKKLQSMQTMQDMLFQLAMENARQKTHIQQLQVSNARLTQDLDNIFQFYSSPKRAKRKREGGTDPVASRYRHNEDDIVEDDELELLFEAEVETATAQQLCASAARPCAPAPTKLAQVPNTSQASRVGTGAVTAAGGNVTPKAPAVGNTSTTAGAASGAAQTDYEEIANSSDSDADDESSEADGTDSTSAPPTKTPALPPAVTPTATVAAQGSTEPVPAEKSTRV